MIRPTPARLEEIRAYVRNGEWNEDGTLFAEIDALRAERDDLLNLHSRSAALVFPGERDTPGAYLKMLRDAESERDLLAGECKQWSARNLELVVERDRLRELLGEAAKALQMIWAEDYLDMQDPDGCLSEDQKIAREALARIQSGLK